MSSSSERREPRLDVALFKWKAWEQEKHQREPGVVYVTDLVECQLKREYEQVFPEVARADFFNPVTLVGDIVHKGVQAILQGFAEARFEVEGEMLFEGVRIRGRADMLLDDRVVDFKYTRSVRYIPYDHHVLQVRIYMRMFGKARGSILYVSPDGVKEVDDSINPDLSKPVTDGELRLLLEGRGTPAYPEWECSYCQWIYICPKVVSRGGKPSEL
jgi:CRISPR-associated exonuclease Cas4